MSHQSELISQDILGYLKQHENKDLLRFLTCGNVDDGKSTLSHTTNDQLMSIYHHLRFRKLKSAVDLCFRAVLNTPKYLG